MRTLRTIAFILIVVRFAGAQSQIHANLEGEDLYQAVLESYKPQFVEIFSNARLLMYKEIYNVNDSVETLYTGHKLYLPPDEELPIQYLAQDAMADGINTEHIYPRSKGAKEEYGNAYSDLHNLAPARWEVNNARSNFAFAEIDNHHTDKWYKNNIALSDANELVHDEIEQYAKVKGLGGYHGYFEPREQVKGDVARSLMYFYTMYRDEALREDPEFFGNMQSTLCKWHNNDPVDSTELERSLLKGVVQDGKANPFVLDCSLANRMYCPERINTTCPNLMASMEDSLLGGEEIEPSVKIFPNPNNGIFTLDISNISPGRYRVDIYLLSGVLLYSINEKLDYFNTINMWNARPGLHILHLRNLDTGRKYSGLFKVVK